jgi:O-antigen/teichoic acid export membrane protein
MMGRNRLSQVAGSSALKAEHLIGHNVIVAAGTLTAGFLGVAFQALISHRFRPVDYGAIFAVMTLLTLSWLPASAVTLVMAREASRDAAEGGGHRSAALLRAGNRWLLLIGFVLAALVALTSSPLARFLNVPVELMLAAAIGIPFGIALPLLLGELQGQQRFAAFSVIGAGQAALKFLGAVALGAVLGPFGVIAGISLASTLIYLMALLLVRSEYRGKAWQVQWRPVLRYLGLILPSTLAMAVLFSADVLLVKHFFGGRSAGQYAAVSALGKAIYWGAAGVAAVLFPKVVFRETRRSSSTILVVASLVLAGAGGILGLALLSFWSGPLLTAFAGPVYAAGAPLLAWYALGMTLLGAAAVMIATHQSRGRVSFLWVLVPIALLEPVLITIFHKSLIQVVGVVDVSAGALLAALGILYLVEETNPDRRASFERILPVVSHGWGRLGMSLGARGQAQATEVER